MLDLTKGGPLAAMAAAIEARLRLVFPASHFGEIQYIPAELSRAVWDKIATSTPAIALQFAGLETAPESGRVAQVSVDWNVYLVVKNVTTARARLLGDARGAGVLDLLYAAVLALHGFGIDGIGSVTCQAARALGAEWLPEANACIGLPIRVGPFELVEPRLVGELDEFLRHGVTWGLPQDAEAATDLIIVREA